MLVLCVLYGRLFGFDLICGWTFGFLVLCLRVLTVGVGVCGLFDCFGFAFEYVGFVVE